MTTALLIIDIQNDGFPGERMALVRSQAPGSPMRRGTGVQKRVITGMMTHRCIDATADAAADSSDAIVTPAMRTSRSPASPTC